MTAVHTLDDVSYSTDPFKCDLAVAHGRQRYPNTAACHKASEYVWMHACSHLLLYYSRNLKVVTGIQQQAGWMATQLRRLQTRKKSCIRGGK